MIKTTQTLSALLCVLMLGGCATHAEVNRLQAALEEALARAEQAEQLAKEARDEAAQLKDIAEQAMEKAEAASNKSNKKVFIRTP